METMNTHVRRDYQESQKDFGDLFAVTETAEKKGLIKGRLEGEAIGRAEGVISVAMNLKTAGSSIELIAQATGLSHEEIEAL